MCAYSYIFYVHAFFQYTSIWVSVVSCVSYVYVIQAGGHLCMLKSDVSKPVHFRPAFFSTATKWHEFILHRATLCPRAVSGVESRCCTQTSRGGWSCILNSLNDSLDENKVLFVNIWVQLDTVLLQYVMSMKNVHLFALFKHILLFT